MWDKGRGSLSVTLSGYDVCHNQEQVIEEIGYNPDDDVRNPSSSVFCAHGAVFTVPWNEVTNYMHLESILTKSFVLIALTVLSKIFKLLSFLLP